MSVATTAHPRPLPAAATLIAALVLCWLPSLSGIWFGPDEWFRTLIRPPLNPPNWVFGPVWSTLYVLMGVALWLLWRAPVQSGRKLVLALFAVQLVLNAGWSWLFFGRHAIGAALVELLLLASVVATLILLARRHSRTAALLLTPYLAWLLFAGYLNFGYWRLNS